MDPKLQKSLQDCNNWHLFEYFQGITLNQLDQLSEPELKAKLNALLVTVADRKEVVNALKTHILLDRSGQQPFAVYNPPKFEGHDQPASKRPKNAHGTFERASVIASGFTQLEGITPRQRFSPLSSCSIDLSATEVSKGVSKNRKIGIKIPETKKLDKIEVDAPTSQSRDGLSNTQKFSMVYESDEDDEPVVVDEVRRDTSNLNRKVKNGVSIIELNSDDEVEDVSDSDDYPSQLSVVPEMNKFQESLYKSKPSFLGRLKSDPSYVFFEGSILNEISTSKSTEVNQIPSCTTSQQPDINALDRPCGTHRIKFLVVEDWTWKNPTDNCPRNLFPLLETHCFGLVGLTFQTNAFTDPTFTKPLHLPCLKQLTIDFTNEDDYFNFNMQLRDIILSTNGGLESIEIYYHDLFTLKGLLNVLKRLSAYDLKGLKSLHIRKSSNRKPSLSKPACAMLAKLACTQLEDIRLEFCLFDDCQEQFEAVLLRFPKLKKVIFTGSFVTRQSQDPKLTINFPQLPCLEHLSFGQIDVCESLGGHANTSKLVQNFVRTEENGIQLQENSKTSNKHFAVTLKLSELPQLNTVTLGRLFQIEDWDFRKYLKVTTFRACSRWDLSVKLSSETSHVKAFPLIEELQLPDRMENHAFIEALMPLFPSLKKCWISLPTVQVVRAFAFAMQDVQSLRELMLDTQFDFPASLKAIILQDTSEIKQSDEEVRQIKTLKAYKHWREYALFHNIDIPRIPVSAVLDENKYAGLSILKNSKITLRHVGRTLRVPQGDAYWTDESCNYSDTIIGFKTFPLPAPAWNLGLNISFINFSSTPLPRSTEIKSPSSHLTAEQNLPKTKRSVQLNPWNVCSITNS